LSAELTKTHSFRLLFGRFCPLGVVGNFTYNSPLFLIRKSVKLLNLKPRDNIDERWYLRKKT